MKENDNEIQQQSLCIHFLDTELDLKEKAFKNYEILYDKMVMRKGEHHLQEEQEQGEQEEQEQENLQKAQEQEDEQEQMQQLEE